jgi:gluconokinase
MTTGATIRPPLHVVVMGVTGTGKSTVARHLARDLGVELVEGDDHHPPGNIAKMSVGMPLTDEDRRPWLEELAGVVADAHARGESTVLACSALRRAYRDTLRGDLGPAGMLFVHLHAPRAVLARRMQRRTHFMPPSLLRSQLDTLEPLEPDEAGVTVDVTRPVDEVLRHARAAVATGRGG